MGAEREDRTEPAGPSAPFDEHFMRLALDEARRAGQRGDTPIGAALVREGSLLAARGNERELRKDPTAHAEMLVLREAAAALGGWRLLDTTLYVTLEPCAMCAGAAVNVKLPRLVFGAFDARAGCCGSVLDLTDRCFLSSCEVWGGVLETDCAALLTRFFEGKRRTNA